MTHPIDTVLARAEGFGLKQHGPSRWRCACPVCGGRNRSTLSIGATDDGAVLLKCFKSECDAEAIARAFGLDIADLFPPRESHGAAQRRRRLLSAGQALELLEEEATFLAVLASGMARGQEVTVQDRDRAQRAAGRISYLRHEARQ
ncbi:MAG TPA: hypothetical protein VGF12_16865 [Roseateles sp.]|uniref:hypothetical protein n=1 Tax=Roseateles sp. TaxID=1971397 RepID=UPI002EDB6BB1